MAILMGPRTEELKQLYDKYMVDERFAHLRDEEINFVPGSGPIEPKVMIIGEAPGRIENARRQPFIGPSGTALSNLLQEIDLDPYEDVFFTNVLKYWPRDSNRRTRRPVEEEIRDSREYLLEEIEIIDPTYIGLCGGTAIKAIFPHITSVRSYHGRLIDEKYIPLYHPAVIGYRPEMTRDVKMGFKMIRNLLEATD